MEKLIWKQCFICSTLLEENVTTRTTCQSSLRHHQSQSDNKQSQIHKTLFQYLVANCQDGVDKSNERKTLVRDILNLTLTENGDTEAASSSVRFCNFCQQLAEEVKSLHLQLEVIQMKLIDKLKTAKQCVISNSRLYGSNEGVRIQFQKYEDWLEQQTSNGTNREKERTFLRVLHRFQTVVFESDVHLRNIPLVYINKYTGGNAKTSPVDASHGHAERTDDTEMVMVKKETMEDDYQDEFESLSFLEVDDYLDEEIPAVKDEPVLEVLSTVELPRKKRGKKRKVAKPTRRVLSAQIKKAKYKTEKKPKRCKAIKSKDSGPTRSSSRAAAFKATKRLNLKLEAQTTAKMFKLDLYSEAQKLAKEMKKEINAKRISEPNQQLRRRKPGLVICEECTFECNVAPRMEQHFMEHEAGGLEEERKYECPDCKKKFKRYQYFEFHVTHFCGTLTWRCDSCQVNIRRQDMNTHLVDVHGGSKFYSCDHCSLQFASFSNLVLHGERHNGAEIKYCLECDEDQRQKFVARQQLLRHLHEDHGHNEIALVCNVDNCSATFYHTSMLARHKHTKHEHKIREKNYKCDLCPQKFSLKLSLSRHLIRDHNLLKYHCDLCPHLKFTEEKSLTLHLKKEHGIGDIEYLECPVCSKKFLTRDRLRRHKVVHSDKRDATCHICGFATKTKALLRRHLLTHGDTEKKHKCSYCQKAFVLKKYLDNHLRIHTLEKPYQCDQCGTAFNQRGSLNIHKKKHLQNDGGNLFRSDASRGAMTDGTDIPFV